MTNDATPAAASRPGLAEITEEILDRLVQTVRVQMNMDVAFISRITGEEFYFRNVAGSGSDVDVAAGVSIPLGATHCQLVTASDAAVLLPDTSADPRSREIVATTLGGVKAYLGVPIRLSNGSMYGTLCCMSAEPATSLTDRDVRFMAVLADVVASEIELHERQDEGDRGRRRAIDEVLEVGGLTVVFQPIVDLASRKVRGYEALSRFSAEPRRTPDLWFADAAAVGRGLELECFALRAALSAFDFSSGGYISLNASPDTVISGELDAVLKGHPMDQIVIEVTEHAQVLSYPDLLAAIDDLRGRGARLAIDDAGAGYAGLRHILLLHPEIIKLDIALTRDIDTDPIRLALGSALVTFARELQAQIVAEGIETAGEFNTLHALGVDLGQGYHIARPAPWATLTH